MPRCARRHLLLHLSKAARDCRGTKTADCRSVTLRRALLGQASQVVAVPPLLLTKLFAIVYKYCHAPIDVSSENLVFKRDRHPSA